MFEDVPVKKIPGFQKINTTWDESGFKILKPDNGIFYSLKYIIETGYIDEFDAVISIRTIYEYYKPEFLILYGIEDYEYECILYADINDAVKIINKVKFRYGELSTYVREAHDIYYGIKKNFQCEEETRLALSIIGLAYFELAGGSQRDFMLPTEEDIMIMERAAYGDEHASCNALGLCRMVCDWRRAGKSEQEIAELLYDNGKWCSLAQIGALLHSDDTRVNADSMKKYATRLLAKPKE